MDLAHGGSGSGDEEASNSRKDQKQYHRHSTEQIERLESFYKECPNPDEAQRQQLSRELGLEPRQIKFWFQNKRTQKKVQNERADSNALRSENERLICENRAMQEALRNITCPSCNGAGGGKEGNQQNLQRLRMENIRLKEEHEKTINFVSNYVGKSTNTLGTESFSNMLGSNFPGDGIGTTTPFDLRQIPHHLETPILPYHSFGINEMDKPTIVETAVAAMDELVELLRIKDPVWIVSPTDGRYMLHRDSYDKLFPKTNHFKSTSVRVESSKDSAEVAMAAKQIVQMLLDSNKWRDMFPNIVTKARTIEVLDSGNFGGSLHLMYEKMHVLSPLVAPREYFFIRYCRQLSPSTWVMVDVSFDFIKQLQDAPPTRSWKLPSGCMIEDMSNGKSTITWIEHVQVDDKLSTHRLYRDLVCSSQAYGAKRWIATLQRMFERLAFSVGLNTATPKHELEGVIDSLEGRRNLMRLSHRMIKNYFEVLSMSDKHDFYHLSEMTNSGVRVSVRKSNGPGEPEGFIVNAATSLWLPFSYENLFNFLRDEKKRAQWDVLANGNPVKAIARISTGSDPRNCISIVQPFVPEENLLMLEESSIDSLGAIIVYVPIHLPAITSAINGEDTTKIPILPSGYVISTDGRTDKRIGTSSSSSTIGSLLTVAYQILVHCGSTSKQLDMESVATVHSLISSTVQKMKVALDYCESD
ncbi:Transcription factor PHOX2/ARIX, contains HOX domain [Handroanthus impetiginosus]|uniref:Transcription factor PHOX2/ARIX, contains HOX domain n=1 Tax=Handroanthus impetiginosus TaxID=429701 RepID=A0A2G9I152_9LAMI|nr:Transcription factor PHOX2/ARIX, contains HOX domain [Handroanthus impetiginosus]